MGKWLEILTALGPTIGALIPGLDPKVIPTIIAGIAEAKQLPGASNDQKKAHVIELVKIGATAANAATKKTVINVEGLTQAAGKGIDAIVQGVNAVHEQTGQKPAA